jgi:hypothetical protein
MVRLIIGNLAGTFVASKFAAQQLPILLCVSQALVRACFLLLKYEHLDQTLEGMVRNIMIISSMVTLLKYTTLLT